MEYEELSRLEGIIEKMLHKFDRLAKEKERLEANLIQKEQDIRELRESVSRLKEEKNLIHDRVSSLITSLEQWEDQAAAPQTESEPESVDQPLPQPLHPTPGFGSGA